jgi:DNA-binding winged helix-turn-helix (wHTH) protein
MVFEFGDFELDESLFELRRLGRRVKVQPKVLALILYLAKNNDRALTTGELFAALWPGLAVGETSLTRAIRGARLALGDSGASQAVVRTVRGQGYRFALPVRGRTALEPNPAASAEVLMAWSERQAPADPASIDIRGRLQALSGACRRALIVAAVIGYEFSLVLLATATKMRPATLTELLEEAVAAGFVRPSADSGSGRQYVFSHGTVRHLLCAGLPDWQIEALHGKVAAALETRHDDGEHSAPS